MNTRKAKQREAIRERAMVACADLYHNATVTYPRMDESDAHYAEFEDWFQGACESELDYLRHGGAYGSNYRATLAAPCNAGKYASPAARNYYIAKGMREMHADRADCGMLTGWRVLELKAGNVALARSLAPHWKVATTPGGSGARLGVKLPARVLAAASRNSTMWEYISEYGKLYTYGRGGRTLAPADLMGRGNSTSCTYDASEHSIAHNMELITVLESFNAHVRAWCASIPEQWRDYCADVDAQALADKRARAARKGKETRERRYWEARDVCTVAA